VLALLALSVQLVMLNQASAFHDRCLSNPVTHLNTHEITPNRSTIALTTTTAFDDLCVQFSCVTQWAVIATTRRLAASTAATLLLCAATI
jgi:hypothetical protein